MCWLPAVRELPSHTGRNEVALVITILRSKFCSLNCFLSSS